MECNHNIMDSENHTLIVDKKKRMMVYPNTKYCYCKICSESLEFRKIDGVWVEN